MACLCAVLMAPLMVFSWALDTKKNRINRYRNFGWSRKKFADVYGVSPTTIRRWSLDKLRYFLRQIFAADLEVPNVTIFICLRPSATVAVGLHFALLE